ncbi:MAG: hypothetical protein HOW73_39805 [Polyangiaceae bacterium]|nr:hypothetical protein [Polyangiaceae bacterium]
MMLPAARHHDPVGQNFSIAGAVAGTIIGFVITALIKVPAVQIVNIGRFPVGGSRVAQALFRAWSASVKAARAGVKAAPGEAIGQASEAAGEAAGGSIVVAGAEISDGSNDVFINLRKAARVLDPVDDGSKIAEGSETVVVNKRPAARKSDKTDNGNFIMEGSENVLFAGPKTTQTSISPNEKGPAADVALEALGGVIESLIKKKNPAEGALEGAAQGLKNVIRDHLLGGVKSLF